jgi:hypothetical protein
MGLAANLLSAIGDVPRFVDLAPSYPDHLPGGVHPELDDPAVKLMTTRLPGSQQTYGPTFRVA